MAPNNLANPDLGWETNKSTNIGLDFAFFKRLQGAVDVYQRFTDQMLLDVPVSQTSGFTSTTQNVGNLRNRGIEGTLSFDILKGPISWIVRGNISRNVSKILDLGGDKEITASTRRKHRVGGSFQEYYLYDWAGVNPANGLAMWYDTDGNVTENFNEARRVYAGKIEPDFQGGVGTDFSWKGIGFTAFFDFKVGNSIYLTESRYYRSDGYWIGNGQSDALLDYWQKPGDITVTPKPIAGNSTNSNVHGNSRFLDRGDFFRVKELTLSYSFPTIVKKIKMNSLKVYVSGANVYTWHDAHWFDPDRNVSGEDAVTFPHSKSIIFGIEIGI
jgi:hypothetical protein